MILTFTVAFYKRKQNEREFKEMKGRLFPNLTIMQNKIKKQQQTLKPEAKPALYSLGENICDLHLPYVIMCKAPSHVAGPSAPPSSPPPHPPDGVKHRRRGGPALSASDVEGKLHSINRLHMLL